MAGILVIVPCGQAKIWDIEPARGSVPARQAYIGSPFKVNKAYAERFADRWVILSAKYGFVDADFMIPGSYNITFNKKSTAPVSVSVLQGQVKSQALDQFTTVIGLGGKEYQAAVRQAFGDLPMTIRFPFAGLRLGMAMQAAKQAIVVGQSFPDAPNH